MLAAEVAFYRMSFAVVRTVAFVGRVVPAGLPREFFP